MPNTIKRPVKPIEIPALLRELDKQGYKKGAWEKIKHSDMYLVKAWRKLPVDRETGKGVRINAKIPRRYADVGEMVKDHRDDVKKREKEESVS